MKLNHESERVFKGLLQPQEIHHKFLTRILLNPQTFPFEDVHHHRIKKKNPDKRQNTLSAKVSLESTQWLLSGSKPKLYSHKRSHEYNLMTTTRDCNVHKSTTCMWHLLTALFFPPPCCPPSTFHSKICRILIGRLRFLLVLWSQ